MSAGSLWYESSTNNQTQKDISTTKPLGGSSRFGDIMGQLVPNALYTIGMFTDAYFTSDPERERRDLSRAYFMLETSVYAGLVTDVLKYGFREPRPDNSDNCHFQVVTQQRYSHLQA